jgi:hypothetical protein
MTILWSNNASTTVSGSITAASTTVQLAAGTGVLFPIPTGPDFFVATFYDQATKTQNEIVHVTNVTGDVATIVRAQEGTIARVWNAGDIFANLVTAGTLRAFVQTGAAPAANTTIVYVGIDTSTVANTIICTTTPVPAALSTGMQFNIWVKNTNTGAVSVQLNGAAGIAATRQNGDAMVHGDITGTEEMIFVYNGVNLTAMVSNVLGPTGPSGPNAPPVTTFYVRTDGNDNNTGFANTPADAFATIPGAFHAISTRYISQNAITIRVADGTYTGGANVVGGFISSWQVIGNTTSPANVIWQNMASGGVCISAAPASYINISGFSFQSNDPNCLCSGGYLYLSTCHFSAPTGGVNAALTAQSGGSIVLGGSFHFSSSGVTTPAFACARETGYMDFGYVNRAVAITFDTAASFSYGTVLAEVNGVVGMDGAWTNWLGITPTGHAYYALTGGGIWTDGNVNFPGTSGGVVYPPAWID